MTVTGFLLCWLLLNEVSVQQIDGTQIAGRWKAVQGQQLLIEREGTVIEVSLDSITELKRPETQATSYSSTWIGINDGSQLRVRNLEFDGKGKTVQLEIAGVPKEQSSVKVPIADVGWIRMKPAIVNLINQQWQAKIDQPNQADRLVVRANDTQLDEVPGTVLAINGESVSFDLDGQAIDAPRERLEGIVFRSSGNDAVPKAIATVTDAGGSQWSAVRIGGEDQQLELETASGIKRRLPIDQIRRIDFRGNVASVTATDVADSQYQTYFGDLLDPKAAAAMFGVRDVAKGLALSAGSSFVVRVEEPFTLFETTVERPENAGLESQMELLIQLDDKDLFKKTLTSSDLPLPIELKVDGGKRLRVQVRASNDTATGDQLLLRKPQFRK